jgi:hypothetical protein
MSWTVRTRANVDKVSLESIIQLCIWQPLNGTVQQLLPNSHGLKRVSKTRDPRVQSLCYLFLGSKVVGGCHTNSASAAAGHLSGYLEIPAEHLAHRQYEAQCYFAVCYFVMTVLQRWLLDCCLMSLHFRYAAGQLSAENSRDDVLYYKHI